MIAVFINIVAIIFGGSIGLLFKHNNKIERYINRIIDILAILVFSFGIQSVVKFDSVFVIMGSLVIGTLIGEFIDIDLQLQKIATILQKSGDNNDNFSKGFVDATLIYCIGAMAIVGSLEAGIKGNNTIIITKSIIDGLMSIVLASKYGKGVLFSALSVGIYQGFLTITAIEIQSYLTPTVILQITNIGGILLIALSLNVLNITKFKLANYLPSLLGPVIFHIITTI